MTPEIRPVTLVVDSACDISPEQAIEWNATIVPLKIDFAGKEYYDGVTLSQQDFYKKLETEKDIPKTSQPSPARFREEFESKVAAGFDVVCITISSKLSGTFQSAMLARDLMSESDRERVFVIDSLNLCVGELLLVRVASRMARQGLSGKLIFDTLLALRGRVRLIGVFDSLKYLAKGGRVPSGLAKAGELLAIKPVLGCEKGKLVVLGKARGAAKGHKLAAKSIKKYGGIDYTLPFHFAYTGQTDEVLRKYLTEYEELYGASSETVPVNCAGATIGTHAGPNAAAIAYFSKK